VNSSLLNLIAFQNIGASSLVKSKSLTDMFSMCGSFYTHTNMKGWHPSGKLNLKKRAAFRTGRWIRP
jgi:hypothetical protein